ncbi:PIN domain-containing protein [Burkholderia cenocepacia]|uniref:PIN domain-containing protein n=2 Tax=Burkholderia cenocepacia TaxID=95486 RepID=UPI001E50D491|nr:PIN domain-containing protein [Burkholderia cenocepacia]MDT6998284.1 PIN domain-containing protein [Burkholderia cenocepacia]
MTSLLIGEICEASKWLRWSAWPITLAIWVSITEMAGYARYTALLDACVLFPLVTTDALLSLATAGFFAAKWTQLIETEWIRSLEEQRPDLQGRLLTRRDSMREAIPDWEVSEAAWTPLIGSFILPDPDDRHVLAAAIAGHADCIVTSNRRDFPVAIASEYGIEIVDPDRFIINQWDLDSLGAMTAFKQMRARRRKPESTVEDFAQALERSGLPSTAQRIRDAADLL